MMIFIMQSFRCLINYLLKALLIYNFITYKDLYLFCNIKYETGNRKPLSYTHSNTSMFEILTFDLDKKQSSSWAFSSLIKSICFILERKLVVTSRQEPQPAQLRCRYTYPDLQEFRYLRRLDKPQLRDFPKVRP